MREKVKVTCLFEKRSQPQEDAVRNKLWPYEAKKIPFNDGFLYLPYDRMELIPAEERFLSHAITLVPGEEFEVSIGDHQRFRYVNPYLLAVVNVIKAPEPGKTMSFEWQYARGQESVIRYIVDTSGQSRFLVGPTFLGADAKYVAECILLNCTPLPSEDNGVDLPLYANGTYLKHYKGGTYQVTHQPGKNIISNSRSLAYGYRSIEDVSTITYWREQSEIEETSRYQVIVLR